jgi:hypothetical protein
MTMLDRHADRVVNAYGTRDLSAWLSSRLLTELLAYREDCYRDRGRALAKQRRARTAASAEPSL